jgi:hypothetical protein
MEGELEDDARQLAAILTEQQLTRCASPGTWSIADCLNHLVVTGNHSLSNIRTAIVDARARGLVDRGPFRHGVIGNWLVRSMDANSKIKFRSPAVYRPSPVVSAAETIRAFFRLQDELRRVLEEADGIDLARVKVANPVTRWLRLSLGQELAFIAAHERRHLLQAARAIG